MTVEVIKAGVLYAERRFEASCRKCKTVVQFLGADVKSGAAVNYVSCPLCKEWIDADKALDLISRDEQEGLNANMRAALGQQQQLNAGWNK